MFLFCTKFCSLFFRILLVFSFLLTNPKWKINQEVTLTCLQYDQSTSDQMLKSTFIKLLRLLLFSTSTVSTDR